MTGPGADCSLPPCGGGVGRGETCREGLDAALLNAHARDDLVALVSLYTEAADQAQARGDRDAMCFFLTHAYVFALETGAPVADDLHARLKAEGREE